MPPKKKVKNEGIKSIDPKDYETLGIKFQFEEGESVLRFDLFTDVLVYCEVLERHVWKCMYDNAEQIVNIYSVTHPGDDKVSVMVPEFALFSANGYDADTKLLWTSFRLLRESYQSYNVEYVYSNGMLCVL